MHSSNNTTTSRARCIAHPCRCSRGPSSKYNPPSFVMNGQELHCVRPLASNGVNIPASSCLPPLWYQISAKRQSRGCVHCKTEVPLITKRANDTKLKSQSLPTHGTPRRRTPIFSINGVNMTASRIFPIAYFSARKPTTHTIAVNVSGLSSRCKPITGSLLFCKLHVCISFPWIPPLFPLFTDRGQLQNARRQGSEANARE